MTQSILDLYDDPEPDKTATTHPKELLSPLDVNIANAFYFSERNRADIKAMSCEKHRRLRSWTKGPKTRKCGSADECPPGSNGLPGFRS